MLPSRMVGWNKLCNPDCCTCGDFHICGEYYTCGNYHICRHYYICCDVNVDVDSDQCDVNVVGNGAIDDDSNEVEKMQ